MATTESLDASTVKWEDCPSCAGTGISRGGDLKEDKPCPICDGAGRVRADLPNSQEPPVVKRNLGPLWKMVYVVDHKCDHLPEGVKFHKFKVETTVEDRRMFARDGEFVRMVVCPYCGQHVELHFVNTRKTAKKG